MTAAEIHLADIEARIATVPGVQLIDRLEPGAQDQANAHGGVIVNLLSSAVAGVYRHQNAARVVDTVRVSLSWQIRPDDQKTSRDEALAVARQIRIALTTLSWNRRTAYAGTTRTAAKGWYLIAQTYEISRDAALGD